MQFRISQNECFRVLTAEFAKHACLRKHATRESGNQEVGETSGTHCKLDLAFYIAFIDERRIRADSRQTAGLHYA